MTGKTETVQFDQLEKNAISSKNIIVDLFSFEIDLLGPMHHCGYNPGCTTSLTLSTLSVLTGNAIHVVTVIAL